MIESIRRSTRQVVLALADWLRDETLPAPDTDVLWCGWLTARAPRQPPAPARFFVSGSPFGPRCGTPTSCRPPIDLAPVATGCWCCAPKCKCRGSPARGAGDNGASVATETADSGVPSCKAVRVAGVPTRKPNSAVQTSGRRLGHVTDRAQ